MPGIAELQSFPKYFLPTRTLNQLLSNLTGGGEELFFLCFPSHGYIWESALGFSLYPPLCAPKEFFWTTSDLDKTDVHSGLKMVSLVSFWMTQDTDLSQNEKERKGQNRRATFWKRSEVSCLLQKNGGCLRQRQKERLCMNGTGWGDRTYWLERKCKIMYILKMQKALYSPIGNEHTKLPFTESNQGFHQGQPSPTQTGSGSPSRVSNDYHLSHHIPLENL